MRWMRWMNGRWMNAPAGGNMQSSSSVRHTIREIEAVTRYQLVAASL
jgi:hypothetical protein